MHGHSIVTDDKTNTKQPTFYTAIDLAGLAAAHSSLPVDKTTKHQQQRTEEECTRHTPTSQFQLETNTYLSSNYNWGGQTIEKTVVNYNHNY